MRTLDIWFNCKIIGILIDLLRWCLNAMSRDWYVFIFWKYAEFQANITIYLLSIAICFGLRWWELYQNKGRRKLIKQKGGSYSRLPGPVPDSLSVSPSPLLFHLSNPETKPHPRNPCLSCQFEWERGRGGERRRWLGGMALRRLLGQRSKQKKMRSGKRSWRRRWATTMAGPMCPADNRGLTKPSRWW